MKYSNLTQLNNSISHKLIRNGMHSLHSCHSLFNDLRVFGNCHEKLGIEIFCSSTTNQRGKTRAFGSKSLGVAQNTATAAIKKRLDRVFLNNEYVLVWASFKPTGHTLSYKLEKLLALDRENSNVNTNKTELSKTADLDKLQKKGMDAIQASRMSTTGPQRPDGEMGGLHSSWNGFAASNNLLNSLKVSKTSLPKNVLNNYCFNVTLPIVGCGIDLLSLHEPYPLATRPADLSNDKPKALSVDVKLVERNYDKLLRTHRVAYFLKQVLETGGLQEKWHCNQLLGAFVKSQKRVNFVGSSELRQSLVLQQALKQSPELMAIQPFVKVIHKFKHTHSGQTRCISRLFQKLTSIIDYKLKQVSNTNISETC